MNAPFEPVSFQCADPPGKVVTRFLQEKLVETTYTGTASPALVESVLKIVPMVMDKVPGTSWLVDMGGTTGYQLSAKPAARAIFEMFLQRGGNRFVLVIGIPMLKFLVQGIAFAAGLPIKIAGTRQEGYELVTR